MGNRRKMVFRNFPGGHFAAFSKNRSFGTASIVFNKNHETREAPAALQNGDSHSFN
jgi:hypothetical protein